VERTVSSTKHHAKGNSLEMAGNNVDWVVQPESWRHRLLTAIEVTSNTYVDFPLTVPENWQLNPGTDQERYREFQGSQTHLVTRGHIHWYLNPTGTWAALFARPWLHLLSFRVRRVLGDPQEQGTGVPQAPTYDQSDAPSANTEYLWHEEVLVGNIPYDEWNATPGARPRWHGTVRCLCRGRRRLAAPDQMVLTVQFSRLAVPAGVNFVPDEIPPMELRVAPHLRSLLSE